MNISIHYSIIQLKGRIEVREREEEEEEEEEGKGGGGRRVHGHRRRERARRGRVPVVEERWRSCGGSGRFVLSLKSHTHSIYFGVLCVLKFLF